MKYTVTYSCGHAGTVELFGPERDRERKLEWYRDSAVCPECYAKQQADERAAIESQYDLPALTGSEKQIAWAEKIRAGFLTERPEAEKSLTVQSDRVAPEVMEQFRTLLAEFLDEFFAESSAGKWIDRRNGSLKSFWGKWAAARRS